MRVDLWSVLRVQRVASTLRVQEIKFVDKASLRNVTLVTSPLFSWAIFGVGAALRIHSECTAVRFRSPFRQKMTGGASWAV